MISGTLTDNSLAVEVNITGRGEISGTLSILHQASRTHILVKKVTGSAEVRGAFSLFEADEVTGTFTRRVSSSDSENTSLGFISIGSVANLQTIFTSGSMVTYVRDTNVSGTFTNSGTFSGAQSHVYWNSGSATALVLEKECSLWGHMVKAGTVSSADGSACGLIVHTTVGNITANSLSAQHIRAQSTGSVAITEAVGEVAPAPYSGAAAAFNHTVSALKVASVTVTGDANASVKAGFVTSGATVTGDGFLRVINARIGPATASDPAVTVHTSSSVVLHDCVVIAGSSATNSIVNSAAGTASIYALGTVNANKTEGSGVSYAAGGIQVNINVP